MIIYTVLVVNGYCISGLVTQGPRHPETFHAINPQTHKIWDMIGFSFYSFEGIGPVMPIYEQTKSSVDFKKTLIAAILILMVTFTCFGTLCYRYFGFMEESKSFVIQNLDQNDKFVEITRLLFCVNLVFSYVITIYPTNTIIESVLFAKMEDSNAKTKWLKNLSRTMVCLLGCFLSITFSNVLD